MRVCLFLLVFFIQGGKVLPQAEQGRTSSEQEIQYDEDSLRTPLDLDENQIEAFKKDKDFDYTEAIAEENWWTRFKQWLADLWNDFWDWVFDGVEPGPFWGFVIEILPYLIILLAVAFIIWLFFKLNPGASIFGKKPKPEVYFTEDEEIIKTKDIQKLIDKAFSDKEYRLAVRYYYLLILQKASEAEVIDYEFDKTNTDYISEISQKDLNAQFVKATDLYDHVWYGNFQVSETDYKKAQKTFTMLERKLVGIKPKTNE